MSRGKKMLRASLQSVIEDRKIHSRRVSPEKEAEFWINIGLDQDGLGLKYFSHFKGYGVTAQKHFRQGDFLLQYVGERISDEEAKRREKRYSHHRCFLYFYHFHGKQECIDATYTRDRLGHMVNDAPLKASNCRMKSLTIRGMPVLCLFAVRDIKPGEELLYDYGDDKNNLWWRQGCFHFSLPNHFTLGIETEKAALDTCINDPEAYMRWYDPDPFDLLKGEVDACNEDEKCEEEMQLEGDCTGAKLINEDEKCAEEMQLEGDCTGAKQISEDEKCEEEMQLEGDCTGAKLINEDERCAEEMQLEGDCTGAKLINEDEKCAEEMQLEGDCTGAKLINEDEKCAEEMQLEGDCTGAKQISEDEICAEEMQLEGDCTRSKQINKDEKCEEEMQLKGDCTGAKLINEDEICAEEMQLEGDCTGAKEINEDERCAEEMQLEGDCTGAIQINKDEICAEEMHLEGDCTGAKQINEDEKCAEEMQLEGDCTGAIQINKDEICAEEMQLEGDCKGAKQITVEQVIPTTSLSPNHPPPLNETPSLCEQSKSSPDEPCQSDIEDSSDSTVFPTVMVIPTTSLSPNHPPPLNETPSLCEQSKSSPDEPCQSDIEDSSDSTVFPTVMVIPTTSLSPNHPLPLNETPSLCEQSKSSPDEPCQSDIEDSSDSTVFPTVMVIPTTSLSPNHPLPLNETPSLCEQSKSSPDEPCQSDIEDSSDSTVFPTVMVTPTTSLSPNHPPPLNETPSLCEQSKSSPDEPCQSDIEDSSDSSVFPTVMVIPTTSLSPNHPPPLNETPSLCEQSKSSPDEPCQSDIEDSSDSTVFPTVMVIPTTSLSPNHPPPLNETPSLCEQSKSSPDEPCQSDIEDSSDSTVFPTVMVENMSQDGISGKNEMTCSGAITLNNTSGRTASDAGAAEDSRRKNKPDRWCLFCETLVSGGKLKRHILRHHKLEQQVQEALLLPKQLQNRFFDDKRREGMHLFNLKQMQESADKKRLMRERRPKYKDKLKMCTGCNRYFSNRSYYKHNHKCNNLSAQSVDPSIMVIRNCHKDNEFVDEILTKFRDSEAGKLCQSDRLIHQVVYRHFCLRRHETSKRDEVRKCVMAEMRELARLYLVFKDLSSSPVTTEDMFTRMHLTTLREAIDQMAETEDPNKEKHGLKLNINSIIMRTIKSLKGFYSESMHDDKCTELEKFQLAYTFRSPEMFSKSRFQALSNSLDQARRPESLPLDQEVDKLQRFISGQICNLMNAKPDLSTYPWLRSLLVSRLTLYNGRRGEEPSRMLVTEWQDALDGVWLPPEAVEKVADEAEKYLVGQFRLAYLHGKGRKYVPVLIPEDSVEAINRLVSLRKEHGIKDGNIFLFATKSSKSHCSGWHAVRDVSKFAQVNINATKNRHRISTLYASLDMVEGDRRVYLDHMGHEERVSKENYQCPHGIKEVCVMGRMLNDLEQGGVRSVAAKCIQLQSDDHVSEDACQAAPANKRERSSVKIKSKKETTQSCRRPVISDSSEEEEYSDGDSGLISSGRRRPVISESSEEEEYSDGDSGLISSANKRERSAVKIKPKKETTQMSWSKEDSERIRSHFTEYLKVTSLGQAKGNKGKLPSKQEILQFLRLSMPRCLNGMDLHTAYLKVRSKVFNERKTVRCNVKNNIQNVL